MKRRISTIILCVFLSLGIFHMAFAQAVTLKEKIGQMLLFGFKGMTVKPEDRIVQAILSQQIGGVVLFDYDFKTKTYDHNIKNPEQLKQLTKQLQHYTRLASKKNHQRFYPLLISIDYEGGKVNRLKENYGFPKTLSSADIALLDVDEAKQYAKRMADTLKSVDINLNYAPVLDVNVNPDNPVIGKLGRSYSKDPEKVVEYASIFSKAYQRDGILCAYKHFPGHGSSENDTHAGFVDVTRVWQQYELEPYKQLFKKSEACPIVMTAHIVHRGLDENGYPASLSKGMTQNLLRDQLGFKGVIITDDLQMKAVTDHYNLAETVRLAINAGADILLFGNQLSEEPQDPKEVLDLIYQEVKAGRIPESRINESYRRIIQLKKRIN